MKVDKHRRGEVRQAQLGSAATKRLSFLQRYFGFRICHHYYLLVGFQKGLKSYLSVLSSIHSIDTYTAQRRVIKISL